MRIEGVHYSIPGRLARACVQTVEGTRWLEGLPRVIDDVRRRWRLAIGAPFDDAEVSCSWVARATREDGTPAVLKLSMPHMEARDEAKALEFWAGEGAVRLLEWDEEPGAMLLEECRPGTSLRELQEPDQDQAIAALLRRLWRRQEGSHGFRALSEMLEYWSAETLSQSGEWQEASQVRAGLELFRELPRSAPAEVVLATDLHAGNVLRAEREPWLAIDPKPFAGDPAYDATQHLFNCSERLLGDPKRTIDHFADLLGVSAQRVRLWMFARAAAEPRDDWRDPVYQKIARGLAP